MLRPKNVINQFWLVSRLLAPGQRPCLWFARPKGANVVDVKSSLEPGSGHLQVLPFYVGLWL